MAHIIDTQQASEYANGNDDLRAAVGAAPGERLEMYLLGVGEHNVNFWFTASPQHHKYVLRVNVNKQPFHESQVAYEFAALQAVEPSNCTPEPIYLDDSAGAPAYGALVISFCEGTMLNFDDLRPGDLRCSAQLIADIHAVPVTSQVKLYRPADPLRDLFDECMVRLDLYYSSAYTEERITKWADRFVDAAKKVLDTPFSPEDCTHIINTEAMAGHMLIPANAAAEAAAAGKSGRFCAHPGTFIDWERPLIGEVAQDVAYFTSPTTTFWDSDFLFPVSGLDGFIEDYWQAVDGRFPRGSFDARFKAYRIVTALRSMSWCCKALIRYSADSQEHKTEKTTGKLPIYLSDEFLERVYRDCCQ